MAPRDTTMDSTQAPSIPYFLTAFIQLVVISSILYGTSVVQFYYYMINCEKEPTWIKVFVSFIFFLESICTALSLYMLHRFTILVILNPPLAFILDWTLCAIPIFICLVQVLVSGFYITRMWLFTKSKILIAIAVALAITRAATFADAESVVCKARTWEQTIGSRPPIITEVVVAQITDGMVAFAIAVPLYRSSPKIVRTRHIVSSLLAMTVNTGLILVVVSLCCMVLFLTLPGNLAWAGVLLLSGKLYANSLFAMLNGRLSLRSRLNNDVVEPDSFVLSSVTQTGQSGAKPVHVRITHEVHRASSSDIGGKAVGDQSVDSVA